MNKILIILLIFINITFASTITVTGYGDTKDKALKSAFQNAIEQELGVLVDSKTIVRNGKLINNKILTFSNGFIDDYKEISSKEQMGFWTVTIKAVVKHNKLLSKIKEIKLKPKKITGTKQLYAKVVSQVKTKFDAEDLFKKFYKTFTSVPTENYYAEVTNFSIDTDLATRTTVPVTLYWTVKYKLSPIVEQQLQEAHNLFSKLSIGTLETKASALGMFESWVFSKSGTTGSNKDEGGQIGIQKGALEPYNLTSKNNLIWYQFPRSYNVIYPFNTTKGFGHHKRKRVGYVKIDILNKNNKVIKTFTIKNIKFKIYSLVNEFKIEEKLSSNFLDKSKVYVKNWKMPIKYLNQISQVRAKIIWQ